MSYRPTLPRLAFATALLGLIPVAVVAAPPAPAAVADAPIAQAGPQELMQSVSKRMFAALDANRAAIKRDPEQVYALVDSILLPHFDTEHAAQIVLAQNWRTATPEQQKRFIDALHRALLRTYGGAIADLTADRLKILPFRGDPAATEATVNTRVTRSSGDAVRVDYRLRKTTDGWKAFDVIIESFSYVKNFRDDLGAEVKKKGLEAMIAHLEREGLNLPAANRQAASGAKR